MCPFTNSEDPDLHTRLLDDCLATLTAQSSHAVDLTGAQRRPAAGLGF
jgi:hypothetical protein